MAQQPIEQTLDELKITEKFEPHRIFVESPKRAELIQIIRTSPRFHFYKVLYESGKSIPELEGAFTSAQDALGSVKDYLANLKQTTAARAKGKWGDKPIPTLETKKRVKKVTNNDDGNIQTNQDNN